MGLPPRIAIPVLTVVAILFLGFMYVLLKAGFSTEGSAFGPGTRTNGGDTNLQATPAPGPSGESDIVTIPQSGSGPTGRLAELNARIARNPDDADAIFAQAELLRSLRRTTDAIAAFRRFLIVAPNDRRAPDARAALGALQK
ncbi:MAG: hypothetical protein WCE44_13885 [Candidatus Velthaea sp.]|jgi:hypothetical protein